MNGDRQILIGLAGLAGAGKDTAARHLVQQHGFSAYALASPIKRGLAAIWPEIGHLLDDPVRKNQPVDFLRGVTPRRLMQTLGTEWGRHLVHPGIWLDLARERWDIERETYGDRARLVITDIRMVDEAMWVREAGGVVIHIRRGAAIPPAAGGHVSEHGLREHAKDYVIVNDGTLSALHQWLDDVLAAIEALASPASADHRSPITDHDPDPYDPGPVPEEYAP